MVANPKGHGPEKDCAVKGQQHIHVQKRSFLSSERAHHKNKTVTVKQ
jgi:hypothetical protein